MQKAIIYCRVSTEEQSNKGLSLDAQEKVCLKAAKEAGYTSAQVIRDEGKSAGNMKRPGLQRILRLCEEGKLETIFMIHSDRLARNTEDHLKLRRFFQETGVKVVYVLQPNLSDNTAFGKTMDTVMAAFNEMQRLVISEKTKSALREKAKEGWFPGVGPLGYINIDNSNPNKEEISKRIIALDPEKAPLVKEMFELYATGNYSVYELVEIMYKKGLRSRRGKMLTPSKVYETLRNPIYIGELHWADVVLKKAKHKPIVSRETFERVLQVMDGHNHHACRRRKHQFLLRGFLYCSCGRRMTAEWHIKKNGLKYAYYHCIERNGCSHSRYLSKEDIEKQVENKFKEFRFSREFITDVIRELQAIYHDHKEQINKRQRELLNKKTAIEQRRDIAEEKLLTGVISDKDFIRIKSKLTDELNGLEDELYLLKEQRDIKVKEIREILKLTRDIHRAYKEEPSLEIKRRYLSFFWQRFEVKGAKIVRAVPTGLFRGLLDCQRVITSPQMGQRPYIIRRLAKMLTEQPYLSEINRLYTMLKLFPGFRSSD